MGRDVECDAGDGREATSRQRRAVRSVEDDTATDDGWAERRSVEGNAGDAGGWAESRSVSKLVKTTLNAGNHHDDALSVGSVKTMLVTTVTVMMLAASGRRRAALKAMQSHGAGDDGGRAETHSIKGNADNGDGAAASCYMIDAEGFRW